MAHALESTLIPGVQMTHHQCPNVKFDLSPHRNLRWFIGHADAGRIDRSITARGNQHRLPCFVVDAEKHIR